MWYFKLYIILNYIKVYDIMIFYDIILYYKIKYSIKYLIKSYYIPWNIVWY